MLRTDKWKGHFSIQNFQYANRRIIFWKKEAVSVGVRLHKLACKFRLKPQAEELKVISRRLKRRLSVRPSLLHSRNRGEIRKFDDKAVYGRRERVLLAPNAMKELVNWQRKRCLRHDDSIANRKGSPPGKVYIESRAQSLAGNFQWRVQWNVRHQAELAARLRLRSKGFAAKQEGLVARIASKWHTSTKSLNFDFQSMWLEARSKNVQFYQRESATALFHCQFFNSSKKYAYLEKQSAEYSLSFATIVACTLVNCK